MLTRTILRGRVGKWVLPKLNYAWSVSHKRLLRVKSADLGEGDYDIGVINITTWRLRFNSSSTNHGYGIRVAIESPSGQIT